MRPTQRDPTLTYADLGLPAHWSPRWEERGATDFYELLAMLAAEVWHRTGEREHQEAVSKAEEEFHRHPTSWDAQSNLEEASICLADAQAGQAALVGWALGQTMPYSNDAESWIQQAMRLVGLSVHPPADAPPASQ